MADQLAGATKPVLPGRQMARRLVEAEAYRRIMAGELPETLSEFAAQLSAWLKRTHPGTPVVPANVVEDALRDTWRRRHDMIGSAL